MQTLASFSHLSRSLYPHPKSTCPSRENRALVVTSTRSSARSLSSNFLPRLSSLWKNRLAFNLTFPRRHFAIRAGELGEDPGWNEDDYIVVGLSHCFRMDEAGKLKDVFLVEPIPAGALECMENGGATCYLYTTATTLGVVLQKDLSLLPKEFSKGTFCNDFDFRTKCASRTWKRPHAVANLMRLVPKDGVRSGFNFNLDSKRILDVENVVSDEDNIKQDLSIDVYGRKSEKTEEEAHIAGLYNA